MSVYQYLSWWSAFCFSSRVFRRSKAISSSAHDSDLVTYQAMQSFRSPSRNVITRPVVFVMETSLKVPCSESLVKINSQGDEMAMHRKVGKGIEVCR